MNWLYTGFFASILLALCAGSRVRFVLSNNIKINRKEKNYNSFFTFLFFGLLTFIAVCREDFVDTWDYRYMYEQIGPNIENAFNDTVPRVEKGYLFITALLNKISTDSQFLLIVFGILTILCFSAVILKYSESVSFSLILFSCNMWISCMNGLRQIFVASLISLVGALWISANTSKKKIFGFICLVLLLSTIHTSALFAIPFYFMAKGKFFNKWIIGFCFITLLLFLIPPFYNLIFELMSAAGLSYGNMLDTESSMGVPRLIISAAPMLLCLIYYYLNPSKEQDKTITWMMNLILIGFLFSILSLKMVYFSRMRMYFNIFSTITLPYVVNKLFVKEQRVLITCIINVLYIAIFLYQLTAYGDEVTNFRLFFETFK